MCFVFDLRFTLSGAAIFPPLLCVFSCLCIVIPDIEVFLNLLKKIILTHCRVPALPGAKEQRVATGTLGAHTLRWLWTRTSQRHCLSSGKGCGGGLA